MRTIHPSFLAALTLLISASSLHAQEQTEETQVIESKVEQKQATPQPAIEPFTGKITKNKVRIRLQPAFDGYVLGELNKGDLVLTLEELEDFYAIKPPAEAKGYVFRTFILDNVVEGTKVNVRLKPDLDAPVVARLNSGDRVEGEISKENNKWYEIKLPTTALYYVSKDYVEKAGDANMMARQTKRQDEVNQLLTNTEMVSRNEMDKPFDMINLDSIQNNYNHIILDFTDFPEAVAKAKTLLSKLQSDYAAKKMAFLETQAQKASTDLEQKNKKLAEELSTHKKKLETLQQQLQDNQNNSLNPTSKISNQLPVNMAQWLPKEESLFLTWSEKTGNDNPEDYYEEQKNNAVVLKGVVDVYNRPVKNKPGDYVLVNQTTKLPIAFLYSTQINLQDLIGHEVTVSATPRPNNNYAFPAFFVLSVE